MITNFKQLITSHQVSLHDLFPTLKFNRIAIPNMGKGSDFFKEDPSLENIAYANACLAAFQKKNPSALLANGYLEERVFYNTERFQKITNGRSEYRNIHLGTDFWVPALTPLYTLFDSEVVISHHNNFHKDYGPLLVLKHQLQEEVFYTLYGHLTLDSLTLSPVGKTYKKGTLFAHIGTEVENGHWAPHLHLQIITDLLQETENYNGVAFASEISLWEKRCPNPSLLFKEDF